MFRTLFFSLLFMLSSRAAVFSEDQKWSGVDTTVVQKVAEEHGRHVKRPLLKNDQGDLLLFSFMIAGTFGGFFLGYYWRKLTEPKERP